MTEEQEKKILENIAARRAREDRLRASRDVRWTSRKEGEEKSHNAVKGTLASIGVGAKEGVKSTAANTKAFVKTDLGTGKAQGLKTAEKAVSEGVDYDGFMEQMRQKYGKVQTFWPMKMSQEDRDMYASVLQKKKLGLGDKQSLAQAQAEQQAKQSSIDAERLVRSIKSKKALQAVDDKYELGKVGEFAQEAGGALGQMLPVLGAGFVGGAAGGPFGSVVASKSALGLQAAAQGYGQALDEGATHEQATRYGTAEGAKEVLTESMFGGMGKVLGRGVLDKAMRMAPNDSVKNVLLNTVKGAAGEGAEEAVSAIADPFLQRATYDPEAKNASFSDVAHQAAIGATLGGILGGGSNALGYRAQKKAAEREQAGAQGAQDERVTVDTSQGNEGLNGDLESRRTAVNGRDFTADSTSTQGTTVKTGKITDESSHIDKRDYKSVGSRKMNAFSYDNPAVRPYYVTEAKRMRQELSEAQKPGKYFGVSEHGLKDTDAFVGGHGRIASQDIVTARDEIGLSYKEIDKALDDIIEDSGRENNANAKKLEVLFDQNLSMGMETGGYRIPPNAEYIRTKEGIAGAADYGYKTEQARYENGEFDPINDNPYAFEATVYAIAKRRGHELTKAEAEEAEALQEVIDADRTAFTEEEIRRMIDEQVSKWKMPQKEAQTPYEQAFDEMLKGEDSTKPKAESEDERRVKEFIHDAAVRARMQVKYVDRPLEQKAYYKDGVIYINKNRPLDEGVKVTVAHELYHALEGTKEHEAIVKLAFAGKDADVLIAEKIEKYRQNGVELDETGARAEIGAEFIEKAMTDEATINQVLLEDRTLAAKILERIKEIIAVYKAKKNKNMSAAEAREYAALLKARRLYEDGLEKLHRDEYAPAGTERARYQAIRQTPDGQKVVVLDQNVLDQRPNTMKKETFIKNYLVDLARNNPDVFARIEENGHKIYLDDNVLPNEYTYSKSAQNARGEIKNVRERALSNLDEIIEVGSNRRFEGNRKENLQPKKADKKRGGMYKYDAKIAIPNENGVDSSYNATVLIRYDQNGRRYLYDIVDIKKDGSPTTYTSQKSDYRMYEGVPSTDNIPNSAENVNSKSQKNEKRFAIDEQVDNTGAKLSKQQQDYFRDSKIRDKNGNLIRVYHNTNAEFTTFDLGRSGSNQGNTKGQGIYLSKRRGEFAHSDYGDKQMNLYANITNPFDMNKSSLSESQADYILNKYASKKHNLDEYDGLYRNHAKEKLMNNYRMMDYIKEYADDNGISTIDIMRDLGYDGIIDGSEVVAFSPEQVKAVDNTTPTDDKDIRYALDDNGGINGERYNELIDRYGRIEPGMEPRVDVAVPKQVNDWDKTRRFVRTAMESENISAEAKDKIADSLASDIANGRFVYEPMSNKKLQEEVNANIAKVGYEKSKAEIFAKYQKNERIKAEDVATLEQLIVKANAEGKVDDVMDMAGLVSMIATEMGQSVQALSMMKWMSPEGRLRQMVLLRDRLNSKYELTGEKQVELNPRYTEMMLDKNNSSGNMETVQSYIIDDMAKQLPVGMKDKFDAWRYLAMLGNPRTHIRNIVGNILNLSLSRINDQLAGVVESVAIKNGTRTKSAGAVSKELREFAKKSWETDGKRLTDMSNKYGERGQAERSRQVFTSKVGQKTAEKWRKWNENAMDIEDTWFKRKQYIYALSHYMKANNITPAEMAKGGVRAEEAKRYAADEAYKVTFQEANALASVLNHFEHKETDSKMEKGVQLAVKALMPFKKTPLNILKRGVEYSPVGLMNGIGDMLTKVRKGKMNATEAINEITQGLTGTGIVALGYFLAEAGLLTAGYDEGNKREQNYENQIGGQNYAITLPGGGTYTLDWAAPAAMPLFVGAALCDEILSREEGENVGLRDIGHALIKITDPVLEMSCMDSLQSALESFGNEGLTSNMITSAVTSYVMQFVPTLSGQIARTIDETKRSTYAPKDSKYTKTGESLGRQFANKVPGLSYRSEAAVDVWGRERKQAGGNIAGRAFNNMLSPGTYSSNKETATDKELKRLYEASGESGVLPKMGSKYISYKADGEKSKTYYLTSKEYTKYQTKYGQDNFQAVSELMRSNVYRSMSDEDKAAAVKEIYTYNAQMANKEFFKGRNVSYDNGASTTEKLKDAGGWAGYFENKQAFSEYNKERKANGDVALGYDDMVRYKETCDKYGIDYTAYGESRENIGAIKAANTEKFKKAEENGQKVKASDKTEANKRAIAQYLASRKDLTNPQRQVIWQEYYKGKTSETYISVARRYGF